MCFNGTKVINALDKANVIKAPHQVYSPGQLSEPPNQGSAHLCSSVPLLSMKMHLNGVQATQKIRNFTSRPSFPAFLDRIELLIQ
jgi:hypothetical protein